MTKKLPHIAVFGLKGFPAIGGTSSVGEHLVKQLNSEYRFTVYATSSHCSVKHPYNNVRMVIFRKWLPHKLNVFYYNLMAAFHALLFCRYHLVHTHQIDTGYIVPLLRLRYKVVSTHHGRTYLMSKWGKVMKVFFRCTERMMVRFANQVTFVSEKECVAARAKYGGRYLTIPNGVDLGQPVDDIDVGEDYIMFAAGRIIPHKGCHIFLEALRKINYQGLVLIAGDHHQVGSYDQELEAYKKDLDIRFLGMVRDKAELLGYVKKARLFVFPSFYEAMSMMLLEAVLMKAPVICSDIEENKAVFNDDEVEFFRVGDVEGLASCISRFLSNSGELNNKKEAAYNKLLNNYQWRGIARKYQSVYKSMYDN